VEITTEKGKKIETFVGIPTGDPRNPLTQQEIEGKFRNQALYSLSEQEVEEVIEQIYDFENLDDVSDLMSSLIG